jgi:hypothetical protein
MARCTASCLIYLTEPKSIQQCHTATARCLLMIVLCIIFAHRLEYMCIFSCLMCLCVHYDTVSRRKIFFLHSFRYLSWTHISHRDITIYPRTNTILRNIFIFIYVMPLLQINKYIFFFAAFKLLYSFLFGRSYCVFKCVTDHFSPIG